MTWLVGDIAVFIGIDPGLSGALAWHCAEVRGTNVLSRFGPMIVWDAPTTQGKNGKRILDIERLVKTVVGVNPSVRTAFKTCFIERAQPSPLMGTVSAFTYGEGYGAWKTACLANSVSLNTVGPAQWKRYFFKERFADKKASKRAAHALAKELYPEVDYGRRSDAGRAEAVLICEYAMKTSEFLWITQKTTES